MVCTYAGLPVKNRGDSQPKARKCARTKKVRKRKKSTKKAVTDSDSEDEWLPWMDEEKPKPRGRSR